MNEYLGMVKLFAGNFAPKGWQYCRGQLLAINTNQALFSILGTTYGGDGITTFGLPDLRNRLPIGNTYGQTVNGLNVSLGQVSGEQNHTLNTNELPSHIHQQIVSNVDSNLNVPTAGSAIGTPTIASGRGTSQTLGFNTTQPDVTLNSGTIGFSGGSQPHDNQQPYLGLAYIICINGLYPSRN